jgi:hypothetical protein
VSAPIGVSVMKIVPVPGMGPIPGIPFRSIPDVGSDDIGGGIRVIGGPAILGAVKVLQDAVQEPVTPVINPGRIGPDPWGGIDIGGWGWITINLGRRGCRRGCQGPYSQQNRDHQRNTQLFHRYLPVCHLYSKWG